MGQVVLAVGILSWVLLPLILGIVAWILGINALKDLDRGLIDESERTMIVIGRVLGIVNVVISIVGSYCLLTTVDYLSAIPTFGG